MDNNQNPYEPINNNEEQANNQAGNQTYTEQPYVQPVYQSEPVNVKKVSPAKSIVSLIMSISSLIMSVLACIYSILSFASVSVFSMVSVSKLNGAYAGGAFIGLAFAAVCIAGFGLAFAIVSICLRNSYVKSAGIANKMARAAKVMGIIGMILNIIWLVVAIIAAAVVSTVAVRFTM